MSHQTNRMKEGFSQAEQNFFARGDKMAKAAEKRVSGESKPWPKKPETKKGSWAEQLDKSLDGEPSNEDGGDVKKAA